MDVQGPLARNVNDVALAFGAMCGFDHRDPISLPITPIAPPARHPRRVGLMRGGAIAALSPAVGAALEQSAVWLQEAGYEVEEIDTAILTEAYRLWYLLCLEEFRLTMPVAEEVGDQGMKTAARHYYDNAVKWWGKSPTKEVFIAGYARRGTLIAQLQELMEDYSLLLTPVSAEQAFIQDADIASPEDMGRIMDAQWPSMSLALLGFPGLSVPTGIAHGLPTGVQIVGRRFGETEMLEAGRAIEREAGVFTPVDPRE
jgi:amidase